MLSIEALRRCASWKGVAWPPGTAATFSGLPGALVGEEALAAPPPAFFFFLFLRFFFAAEAAWPVASARSLRRFARGTAAGGGIPKFCKVAWEAVSTSSHSLKLKADSNCDSIFMLLTQSDTVPFRIFLPASTVSIAPGDETADAVADADDDGVAVVLVFVVGVGVVVGVVVGFWLGVGVVVVVVLRVMGFCGVEILPTGMEVMGMCVVALDGVMAVFVFVFVFVFDFFFFFDILFLEFLFGVAFAAVAG